VSVLGWIIGLALLAMLLMSGVMKLINHEMTANLSRLGVSDSLKRIIGGLEVAAAIGVLIGLLGDGDNEWLGFLAGVGVIALMIGAIVYHQRAGDEPKESAPAAATLALAVLYIIVAIMMS